jgi:hypothetical protein
VFERPADDAWPLRLQLPAAALGEKGSLNFKIPVTMIAASETAQEAGTGRAPGAALRRNAAKTPRAEPEEDAEQDDDGPIAIPGLSDPHAEE